MKQNRQLLQRRSDTWPTRILEHRDQLAPSLAGTLRIRGIQAARGAEDRTNHASVSEITAIPKLIDRIDVKGALVTIDAMGCQKDIAKKIVDAKGDYVLAVKDNQPKLHEAIKEFFSDERQAELSKMPHRQHETSEQSHGRKDQRYYVLAKMPENFPLKDQWSGLKAMGMAVRVAENPDGTTCGDVRYFISSCYVCLVKALRNPRVEVPAGKLWLQPEALGAVRRRKPMG